MNPLITILIPVYNSENWLEQTLDSAINQTWNNKEIIIYDDGSNDSSYKVAKKYENDFIKVFKSYENEGQTATLNKLLEKAKGDFIQYLDSDDILSNDKIENQIKKLSESGTEYSIASCKWTRFYNDNIHITEFDDHADYKDYNDSLQWILDTWNGYGTMPPTAWLIPRKVIDKVGLWDESLTLNNDNEYYSRMVTVADKIIFCPGAKFYYRSGNPSLSGRKDKKAFESLYTVCELSTSNILQFENSERTRKASANLWQNFVYEAYPKCPDLIASAERRVKELGGADLKIPGSPIFKHLSKFIGWKSAKRIRGISYNLGYKKIRNTS